MEAILLVVLTIGLILFLLYQFRRTSKNVSSSPPGTLRLIDLGYDLFETFELTGVHVDDRRDYILRFCSEKDKVTIKPELTNPVNPNALSVEHEGYIIGYIADYDIDEAKEFISNDHQALIRSKSFHGSYLDVEIMIAFKSEDHQDINQ